MHKNLRFLQLGWALAMALIGVGVAGGFQGPTTKIGVVDITKVVEQSDFGKENQVTYKAMQTAREGLLEFLDTYRVLTTDQSQRIKELSLKKDPTDAEKAELERIKADVIAADKRSRELSTKPNMTPEERTLVEDYARRAQAMADVQSRWFREFSNELQTWADKQKLAGLEKAREATREVAKAQGFTVVLEIGIAPYGSDEITEAALKAMNTKK